MLADLIAEAVTPGADAFEAVAALGISIRKVWTASAAYLKRQSRPALEAIYAECLPDLPLAPSTTKKALVARLTDAFDQKVGGCPDWLPRTMRSPDPAPDPDKEEGE